MEATLVPIVGTPEEFVPTEEEANRAFALQQEFLGNTEKINVLFERQVQILRELHEHPRLCRALGYDSIWQFLQDPEVENAMRVRVGSRSQLYRLVGLAEVDARFPNLQILREPHLSKLTHSGVLSKLQKLGPSEEEQAELIIAEVRSAPASKLNSMPLPKVETDGHWVLVDGERVLKVRTWSPLAIRAVSKLAHLSPAPGFKIRDGKLLAWQDGQYHILADLETVDDGLIEFVRDRLQATRD